MVQVSSDVDRLDGATAAPPELDDWASNQI
jgi:hypothetical protein